MNDDKPTKKNPTMVLVSACLLGIACRYDGESKPNEQILSYNRRFSFIPFCPETYGGLSTPRVPAEIQADGRVVNAEGIDVTAAYQAGAELPSPSAKTFIFITPFSKAAAQPADRKILMTAPSPTP